MPTINIKYDDSKVTEQEIISLSRVMQSIMRDITGIEDTFVYADSPKIKIDVAPIEVYVELSASKVPNKESMFQDMKTRLSSWKKENNFAPSINLTFIPIDWALAVDI